MDEFNAAESALFSLFKLLVLGASLSRVVWLALALWVAAEVLPAVIATDAILTHAYCCLSSNGLTLIILLTHIDLSLDYLHDIATATSYQCVVLGYQIILFSFLQLLHFLLV